MALGPNMNNPPSRILLHVVGQIDEGKLWEGLLSFIGQLLWVSDLQWLRYMLVKKQAECELEPARELYLKYINACDYRINDLLKGD